MKKSWTVIAIVLALLIGMICGGSMVGFAADSIFGDIDGDGKITAGDARLILRHVAKIETLKEPVIETIKDGKVIFNEKDIRITYVSLTISELLDTKTYKVNLLIENNGYKKMFVTIEDVAINGYMAKSRYYPITVAAKKKTNESLLFYNIYDFTPNGIDTLKNVSFTVKISEDDYNVILSKDVTLYF